jgi:hypothetical protein
MPKNSQKLIDNHRKLARGLTNVRLVRVGILVGFAVTSAGIGILVSKNGQEYYKNETSIENVRPLYSSSDIVRIK